MDRPVVLGKLSELHRVVAHRGQAVAAGLPRQQDAAGLNVFLTNHGAAGGLGTSWRDGRAGQKVRARGEETFVTEGSDTQRIGWIRGWGE